MMEQNLELALSWLGLDQYCERFVHAGFDTWETLLDVTEEDLEVLDVDLGHRRKLQKEIRNSRARDAAQQRTGANPQQQQGLGARPDFMPDAASSSSASSLTAEQADSLSANANNPSKRGYRHHPKPDPNAPKRPYSAYVLFSNHVREELAPENLDFPNLSRQVGQRWQALSAEEKDRWKQLAQGPRDKYKEDVTRYWGSAEHSKHKEYLDDFQAKQASRKRRGDGHAMAEGRIPASPIQKNGSASVYFTSRSTSTRTSKTFGDSHESMTSSEAPHAVASGVAIPVTLEKKKSSDNKAPIPRTKQRPAREMMENPERKARSKQACEPCRQKKTKCDEERPICGRCLEMNVGCHYSNGKETKDERKFIELSKKLDACQDILVQIRPKLQSTEQNLIQQALDMPPTPNAGKSSIQQGSHNIDASPSSPDDAELSADDTPGLGLMEASGLVYNDDYALEGMGIQPGAFAGQSSDVQWIRKLTVELNRDREGNSRRPSQQRPILPSSAEAKNTFAEDKETVLVGENVDPFQVPIKTTADALVDGYFRTIHASFPILHRSLFMRQYNELRVIWHKPVDYEDRMFVTTLQLVFAIGAVHARLSGAIEVSDDRDHMLYFARARLLAVDSGIFNDQVHIDQAQVFGLGAMYCLVTDQMNRAWIASGLALRSAQSLGLHLHNVTPSVSKADKELRSQIWFALLSFERTLGVMSGRPSMVQDWDCNHTLPPPVDADPASPSSLSEEMSVLSSPIEGVPDSQISTAFQSSVSEGSHNSYHIDKIPSPNQSLIEATYFSYHVELSGLAHEAVSHLYSPAMRQYRWSKIQAKIDDYDDRLTKWKTNLEPPFNTMPQDVVYDPGRSPLSIALSIQFHCVRAIVNRPCLYRRERTAFRQNSHNAVSRCIGSARAVIDIVCTSPTAALIHQGPKWWLLLHHTKRALTVVLLELAFHAEHMPSEAEELLAEAKKALAWLQEMARTSKIAEHTWNTMRCLLVKAARRVGMDAGHAAFQGNNHAKQQTEGRPHHHSGNDSTNNSHLNPMPAPSFLQSHGGVPPSQMRFGVPTTTTDSTTFGTFLPQNNNNNNNNSTPLLGPYGDQLNYQDFVDLETFDQFSFDPISAAGGQQQSFYTGIRHEVGAGAGGAGGAGQQMPSHSSTGMPFGFHFPPPTMPQMQNHQQQHHYLHHHHHRGRGIRAEGYLMDDPFGFDPGRSP